MDVLVYKLAANGKVIIWTGIEIEESVDENGEVTQQEVIPEGATRVQLPEEVAEHFVNNHRQYKVVNGVITLEPTFPVYRGVFEMQNEVAEIKAEMAGQDYKRSKYIDGLITEEEWLPIKNWFNAQRARINDLEVMIQQVRAEEA